MQALLLLACFIPQSKGFSLSKPAASRIEPHALGLSGNRAAVSSVNQTQGGKNIHLAGAAGANKDHAVMLPLALGIVADQCKCRFTGLCTCGAAVEFMDCINDACATGACDCKAAEFLNSCSSMAGTCPNVGLQCTAESSTCLHAPVPINMTKSDIVQKLETLKVRKCNLQDASNVGYVNAGIRLKALLPEIQSYLDMLRMKGGEQAVYMGCAAAPKGQEGKNWIASWEAGAALDLPSHKPVNTTADPPQPGSVLHVPFDTKRKPALLSVQKTDLVEPAVVAKPAEPSKPAQPDRSSMIFVSVLCHITFILLVAFFYDRVRLQMVSKQPDETASEDPNSFKFGLFGCFSDWKICCFTFWCFQVRWADTMDKANKPDDGAEAAAGGETGSADANEATAKSGETISYGHGVLLLLALWLLGQFVGVAGFNVYLGTVVFLATLFVLVRYRQKLRTRYMLSAGTMKTYMEDVLAYLCCPCCAAVQEARHVEAGMTSTKSCDDSTDGQQQEVMP